MNSINPSVSNQNKYQYGGTGFQQSNYAQSNNFDYYRNNNLGNNFVGSMDVNENLNSNFLGNIKGGHMNTNQMFQQQE